MNKPKFEKGDSYQLMEIINQGHAHLDQINKLGNWQKFSPGQRQLIQQEALHLLVRIWKFNTWNDE